MQDALCEQRQAAAKITCAALQIKRVKYKIDTAISYLDAKEVGYSNLNECAVILNNQDNPRTFAQQKEDDLIIYTDGSFREVRPGLYQYRFMLNKEQKSVYGKTDAECYKKRHDYNPKRIQKDNGKLCKYSKYNVWLEFWKLNYKKGNVDADYYDNICRYIKNYIKDSIGKNPLNKITSMHVQAFLAGIESDNTRTKVAAVLSESLRAANEARLLLFNPYQGIKIKKMPNKKLGALTHQQQLDLLKLVADNKELSDIITILLLTGLRQGELLALTRDDVDLTGGKIIVSKSQKKRKREIKGPKTQAGYRTVPISKEVIEILKKRKTYRLFEYNLDYIGKKLSKAIKAIGTDYAGNILRHTFITNAYELEFPPYIVKCIAGHDKIDNAQPYLALRRAEDFIETLVVKYMRGIKALFVKVA